MPMCGFMLDICVAPGVAPDSSGETSADSDWQLVMVPSERQTTHACQAQILGKNGQVLST
jgi:hypothetical protein